MIKSAQSMDLSDLLRNNWVEKDNKLSIDFNIYSTYEQALLGVGAWKWCNFDYPGVGFPRDCGIDSKTDLNVCLHVDL